MSKSIGLSEFINRVRHDLLSSARHETPDPLFAITDIEIEIGVQVERGVNGGIDLHVVQMGADRSTSDTHVVRMRLTPLVSLDELRASLSEEQRQAARKPVMRSSD